MTSKEALSDLSFLAIGDENHIIKCKETIEKDLERLEKLEKDIEILKKALKDGINVYYEDEERYQFHNNLRLEYHKTLGWGLVYIYGCSCRDDMPMKLDKEFYELKEYGKTWALTKEELEDDK